MLITALFPAHDSLPRPLTGQSRQDSLSWYRAMSIVTDPSSGTPGEMVTFTACKLTRYRAGNQNSCTFMVVVQLKP